MSVCKRLKQAVCKTAPFRFAGSNPARHTIRPLRQVGPSRQPLKLESAVRVCQGSYKHLCQKGASCRGRLTVGQRTANPSRGKTALTTKCQSNPRLRVRISLSAPYACVSEWLMELVQKTSGQKWPVGSNPTTCATQSLQSLRLFVDFGDFFLFDAPIRGIMATENSK